MERQNVGRRRIGIFFKTPEPGRVKTRLSPALPPATTVELYRAFVEDTIALARRVPDADLTLFHGGDSTLPDPRVGISGALDLPWLPQSGQTLGARMADALSTLLAPPGSRALLIGTDAPDLPPEFLVQAFDLLEVSDITLGPASDGGYYLIGVGTLPSGLFDGIAWSTASVLAEQRARAEMLGLRVALLPPWDDVDRPADLDALRERLAKAPEAAPASRRAFKLLDSHN